MTIPSCGRALRTSDVVCLNTTKRESKKFSIAKKKVLKRNFEFFLTFQAMEVVDKHAEKGWKGWNKLSHYLHSLLLFSRLSPFTSAFCHSNPNRKKSLKILRNEI